MALTRSKVTPGLKGGRVVIGRPLQTQRTSGGRSLDGNSAHSFGPALIRTCQLSHETLKTP